MAKKKQKPIDPDTPEDVKPYKLVPEESAEDLEKHALEVRKQQEEQASLFLKNILDPINQNLQVLASATKANADAIKVIMEKKEEGGFNMPPEIMKAIPDIIQGIIGFFTQPETPPEAAKMGLFDEEMMSQFKKKMILGWDTDEQIKSETLRQLRLANDMRSKELEREY